MNFKLKKMAYQKNKFDQSVLEGLPIWLSSLEDLKKAMASETEELWLVKLPKNFRADRMEGQEIKFPSEKKSEGSETKTSLDLKNNGVIQNAIVTANTFSLPFVFLQY